MLATQPDAEMRVLDASAECRPSVKGSDVWQRSISVPSASVADVQARVKHGARRSTEVSIDEAQPRNASIRKLQRLASVQYVLENGV